MNASYQHASSLLRSLFRKPGFAIAVVLTLTLGIGANTATLSLLYGYLLAPLPYPQAGQLVQVKMTAQKTVTGGLISGPVYFDLLAQSTVLADAAIYRPEDINLDTSGRAVHANGVQTTASLFTILGVRPLIGHVFGPAANQPGAAGEAVLSYRLWSQEFDRNPDIVGRTVRLNDKAYTVSGVMPENFQFPDARTEAWVPMTITANDHNPEYFGAEDNYMIARLKPAATPAEFNAQTPTIVDNAIAHFPYADAIPWFKNQGFAVRATPLRSALVGELSHRLMLVQIATALLLLLVWFNLANLFIARALARRGELILRRVLGADTRVLFRQLFTESLALCVIGAIAGLIFGEVLMRILLHSGFGMAQLSFPTGEWGIAVGIAAALAILSALVFSFAGLYFVRRQDLAQALREGDARSSGGAKEHRVRAGLVITQLVLACVLTGTGIMLAHSLMKLGSVKLGFQPEHLVTFQIHLPVTVAVGAKVQPDVAPPLARIYSSVTQVPGVRHVTVTNAIPFASSASAVGSTMFPYPATDSAYQHAPDIVPVITDAGYFKTFAIPLLAGRNFTAQDANTLSVGEFNTPQGANPRVGTAVLDTTAAKQLFGTVNAVGREFNFAGDPNNLGVRYKVIGVVATAHRTEVGQAPRQGTAYFDRDQVLTIKDSLFATPTWYVAVRTPLSTAAIVPALSRAVAQALPGVPIYDVRSMDQRLSSQLSPRRGLMTLVLMFALGALLLAAVGLYAVQSYSVSQRLREFGIRAALGAERRHIVGQVLFEIAKLLVIGLVLGLIGVVLFGHVFSAALYDVNMADPVSLFLVFVILSVTALVAGWIPAWRASHVPPMQALRDG